MGLLDSLIGPATTLASKFIPDKDLAAKLGHELATMSEKIASEQAHRLRLTRLKRLVDHFLKAHGGPR
jgi:hypothetical protein